jgi:transposase
MEVLTRWFTGIIVCDGWKPYATFTKRIQRCWAHLLRESEYLAEKIAEAAPLDKALRRLYRKLNDALEADPPPETRRQLWYVAQAALRRWIRREYASEKVKKFIGKIENGFEYWFTFVLRSDVSIHERIMTVLTTWAQQGLNSFQMLRSKLRLSG